MLPQQETSLNQMSSIACLLNHSDSQRETRMLNSTFSSVPCFFWPPQSPSFHLVVAFFTSCLRLWLACNRGWFTVMTSFQIREWQQRWIRTKTSREMISSEGLMTKRIKMIIIKDRDKKSRKEKVSKGDYLVLITSSRTDKMIISSIDFCNI